MEVNETLKKGEEILRSIKADIDSANSSIGRLEGHKKALESKRDSLYEECKAMGIEPDKVETYLEEGLKRLDTTIDEAQGKQEALIEFNNKIKAVV